MEDMEKTDEPEEPQIEIQAEVSESIDDEDVPKILSPPELLEVSAVAEEEKTTTFDKSTIKTFTQISSEKESTTTMSRLLKNRSKQVPESPAPIENTEVESKEPEVPPVSIEKVATPVRILEPKAAEYVPPKMDWKRKSPFMVVYTKDNPPKINKKPTTSSNILKAKPKSSPPKSQEETQEEKSKDAIISSPLVTRKRDKIKKIIKKPFTSKRARTAVSLMLCLFLSSSHSKSTPTNVIHSGKQLLASTSETLRDFTPVLDKTSTTSTTNTFTSLTEKQIELSPLHKKRIMDLKNQEKHRKNVYVATTATTSTINERKEEVESLLKVESHDDETFVPFSGSLQKINDFSSKTVTNT